jgi:hypothetical protein
MIALRIRLFVPCGCIVCSLALLVLVPIPHTVDHRNAEASLSLEEFLFLFLPKSFLINELFVYINVLVGHSLRNLFCFYLFYDLRFNVSHEKRVGGLLMF